MEKINKSTDEILKKAIRIIDKVITLKANVFNGNYRDQAELDIEFARLENIKKWAIENDQMPTIINYFNSHNFGRNNQFAASEISDIFYN